MAAWRANKKISRTDAKTLSWVVNSFKTQMAPMITDVPPLVTRTGNSNCRIAAISAFFLGLSRVKDTLAVSLTNGGGGVGDIEFFVDVFDVVGHRGDADAEALRDFFL